MPDHRSLLMHALAHALAYGGLAAVIGTFSMLPRYQAFPDDAALLRLSFTHPGRMITDCRERTPEELAKLPPNMRTRADCPRERSPVAVQVKVDGHTLVDATFQPAGLHRDGASSAYRAMPVRPGAHVVRIDINDDRRASGFNHSREERITVGAGDVILVDFAAERGGIVILGGQR